LKRKKYYSESLNIDSAPLSVFFPTIGIREGPSEEP